MTEHILYYGQQYCDRTIEQEKLAKSGANIETRDILRQHLLEVHGIHNQDIPFKSDDYYREMERHLDALANGETSLHRIMQNLETRLQLIVDRRIWYPEHSLDLASGKIESINKSKRTATLSCVHCRMYGEESIKRILQHNNHLFWKE